jgi:membrane protein involved in colicin uptake
MSAPITEAHRKLRETLEIRWMRATELEIEQLIADSEARACDQLRAEVEHFKFLHQCESDSSVEAFARAYRAEAEVAALKQSAESGQCVLREDAERNAARAERAEAEIKDRAAMMRDVMRERDAAEAELATEREKLSTLREACGHISYIPRIQLALDKTAPAPAALT